MSAAGLEKYMRSAHRRSRLSRDQCSTWCLISLRLSQTSHTNVSNRHSPKSAAHSTLMTVLHSHLYAIKFTPSNENSLKTWRSLPGLGAATIKSSYNLQVIPEAQGFPRRISN